MLADLNYLIQNNLIKMKFRTQSQPSNPVNTCDLASASGLLARAPFRMPAINLISPGFRVKFSSFVFLYFCEKKEERESRREREEREFEARTKMATSVENRGDDKAPVDLSAPQGWKKTVRFLLLLLFDFQLSINLP